MPMSASSRSSSSSRWVVAASPFPRHDPGKRNFPPPDVLEKARRCIDPIWVTGCCAVASHGFTSVSERNNAWLRELIGRLSISRAGVPSYVHVVLKPQWANVESCENLIDNNLKRTEWDRLWTANGLYF